MPKSFNMLDNKIAFLNKYLKTPQHDINISYPLHFVSCNSALLKMIFENLKY